MFTFDPQRLAACCQDVDVCRTPEDGRGEGGGSFDDVLAIVEHQQQPAILERTDQARNRIIGSNVETEHLRDGTGDQPRVGERRQIDEPGPMFIGADRGLGRGEGDRGFADAAGPDNAQQPLPT
jgi:hypothetical protein